MVTPHREVICKHIKIQTYGRYKGERQCTLSFFMSKNKIAHSSSCLSLATM